MLIDIGTSHIYVDRGVTVHIDPSAAFADDSELYISLEPKDGTSHPLAQRVTLGDISYTLNEVFRAVHDINGHGSTLAPFETIDGETQAWRNHRQWYPPSAWPALDAETLGQVAYSAIHGDFVPIQEAKVIHLEGSF